MFETEDGTWELIDGLQRISTILEFMGLLKDDKSKALRAASHLEGTYYLPSLKNAVWEVSEKIQLPKKEQRPLPKEQQFFFRMSKINVNILKRPSDPETKYDLFQRLNRGGTIANAQEVRNCMVIMISEPFYKMVEALTHNESFRRLTRITETGEQKQRPYEQAMRFLVFLHFDYDGILDVEEFIDNRIMKLAEKPPNMVRMAKKFTDTFELLDETLGEDALRKWDPQSKSFSGRAGQVALEVIAVGVARNLPAIVKLKNPKAFVEKRIKEFWSQPVADRFVAAGFSGTYRLKSTIEYGASWFAP